ncbi:Putative glycoside hydrolase [Croceitalea dokdonensis DOKDO 023]|uniref:Putative glycoside hydrolase n=1 Tax=Croceitalea dokdonensis DOKDO 023 TaxID=1300341 RepID=A0A0N8H3V9_9FLAO|nr:family 10 glycosylhydrolase [Croceitalea dokdonensis]KPM31660.1 Putative glycoside hydrolase [Croceitalea dokdonensis DOKDO 023]
MKKTPLLLILVLASCAVTRTPKEEFRGVWIATVVNIDWPKQPGDKVEKQKTDFKAILDFYGQLHFNAAIVQIRTAGDAFYPSKLAPWSRYLTGKEGKPPELAFGDPLKWLVSETHKKGMEFHAWLNPYRATFNLDTLSLSASHDFYQHRDWMVKYGNKYYYNPGIPEVQQHLVDIIAEVVEHYEIDAIHFDDYFYPYRIENEIFNDSLAFSTYAMERQSLADWRRSNVDSLVKYTQNTIKELKPWVQFGISPFGVWKNNTTDPRGSATRAGQTNYEDLYADPISWIENNWLDYLAPQAYWSLDYPAAPHRVIAEWWNNEAGNTNVYMGNGPYKIKNNADKAWNRKKEIPKQLTLARKLDNIQGNIFFSAKSLIGQHSNVVRHLRKKQYQEPSLPPTFKIQKERALSLPSVAMESISGGKKSVSVVHKDSIPRYISLYKIKKNNKTKVLDRVYLAPNDTLAYLQWKSNKVQNHGLSIEIRDAFGNYRNIKYLH